MKVDIAPARRLFLSRSGLHAQSSASMEADVGILNVALGLEHEAINAYQLGAGSGLLQKPVLDVAVAFQSHHKAHRDALIATVQKMGGRPVGEKSLDDYAKALAAAGYDMLGDLVDQQHIRTQFGPDQDVDPRHFVLGQRLNGFNAHKINCLSLMNAFNYMASYSCTG